MYLLIFTYKIKSLLNIDTVKHGTSSVSDCIIVSAKHTALHEFIP